MKPIEMKTTTLILTILYTLSASALNVLAEHKILTSGTWSESGSSYQADGGNSALFIDGPVSYTGSNITLSSTVAGSNTRGNGLHLGWNAAAADTILRDSTITVSGTNSSGVVAYTGKVTLRDVSVSVSGFGGQGAYFYNSRGDLDGLTVIANADRVNVLRSDNHAIVNARNIAVTLSGSQSLGLVIDGNGAFMSVTNGTVITSGEQTRGVYMGNTGDSTLHLTDVNIESSGSTAAAIDLQGWNATGKKTLVITGGTIAAPDADALLLRALSNNWDEHGVNDLTISGATLTGAHAAIDNQGAGVTTINFGDGATGSGDILASGSARMAVNLADSQLIGNVNASEDAVLTLSGSNGTTITGAVSGNDRAAIDLTVSGPGSSFAGDTNQNDDAKITVTIDNGAIGSGGFHDGNLITGGDSAWTFNQDSHGNYGENNGVWNIGDYEVIFDNLTHSGTVTISVNSDTGTGGSITVTGAADGGGTVHIDTTGNGQLNPNDVLPGIVSGDGTEHWQWDPINWGIDTIIKDGDYFVKHGTSPAGAVLNSSVAIQQAMWFAQQNSLLKRMGDLRYGARASRPLAGETPAFHNLIENIWLRSYGQQLNIGSQVSGKAYEQLIYGVDLGTDHKFSISADSDLYLGVYAGYGRSDLDYRTPGTDGELNSYYGGLYATWLHSSGFYIDATVKAANVDNDLKAPYGTTQLTASYSDINLGGSIEIGNKFTFTDGWFIEPQFQVNYLHILAENYTAGPLTISAQDLDALQ
ncbi:MAG: autotransporter outer membrane beta-barrel domain-containing protein, partial [Verrucomicrobiales bacterium]|nr:autotransporter outer membrane beta-barrel domain-containing protein [Verrucomicrobiales bacterium]